MHVSHKCIVADIIGYLRIFTDIILILRIFTDMIHTFNLEIDWGLVEKISRIDRFRGEWKSIEKREKNTLSQLRSMATVESVGASTRIEGAKLNDMEINRLIRKLDTSKLEARDEQEIAGYYNVLNNISSSFNTIGITENNLKGLHNQLLQHSIKDEWHRGDYKQLSNSVEATGDDGKKVLIFETTPPGIETDNAMHSLIEWYATKSIVHPLVNLALFTYEFVSIHPFQDGNGRMSRLISTLLLLQKGYNWVEFVSFEHEIEARKGEYYTTLRSCQANRPGEDVSEWLTFFLSCLENLTLKLIDKIARKGSASEMTENQKAVYTFIENNPGAQVSLLSARLGVPNPTIKKRISELLKYGLIQKYGVGRATNYKVR